MASVLWCGRALFRGPPGGPLKEFQNPEKGGEARPLGGTKKPMSLRLVSAAGPSALLVAAVAVVVDFGSLLVPGTHAGPSLLTFGLAWLGLALTVGALALATPRPPLKANVVRLARRLEANAGFRAAAPRLAQALAALCAAGAIAAALQDGIDVCGHRFDDLPGHPCVLLLILGLASLVFGFVALCGATAAAVSGCAEAFRWIVRRGGHGAQQAAAALGPSGAPLPIAPRASARRGRLRAPPLRARSRGTT